MFKRVLLKISGEALAAGRTYATLQSFYEYLIVLKTKELREGSEP